MGITNIFLDIKGLGERTIDNTCADVITVIHITDKKFEDNYKIIAQKTNLGIDIMCQHNGVAIYQADSKCGGGGAQKLWEVVNAMSGGSTFIDGKLILGIGDNVTFTTSTGEHMGVVEGRNWMCQKLESYIVQYDGMTIPIDAKTFKSHLAL